MWANLLQLSSSQPLFRTLPDAIAANEQGWRRWLAEPELERYPPPDLDAVLAAAPDTSCLLKLMLIRSVRLDRFHAAASDCIRIAQAISVPERADAFATGVFRRRGVC